MNDAPIAKLPVWRTTIETYRLTGKAFWKLFPSIWPWLALWIIFDAAISWLNWPFLYKPTIASHNDPLRIVLSIVTTLSLVSVFFGAIIAVPWHRYLLLGEVSETKGIAHIHKNFYAYFVTALLLGNL